MFFFGAVSNEVAARPLGGWHNGIIIAGLRTVVRVPTAPRLLRTALAMSNFAFLLPAFHSITSSARIRSDGGIDSCRAFARDDLPPPNEHLARKETLLSRALKHERVCYAIVGRTSPSADREGRSDPFTGGYPLVGQMIPARRVAHSITSSARARSVGGIAVTLVLTFYLVFYFLRDREAALNVLLEVSPLPENQMRELFRRVAETIHATLYGTLIVAAVQGTLGGLIFWWLALPAPLLWGVVMGALAIVPVLGAFVVWIPAAVFLALNGNWLEASIL